MFLLKEDKCVDTDPQSIKVSHLHVPLVTFSSVFLQRAVHT